MVFGVLTSAAATWATGAGKGYVAPGLHVVDEVEDDVERARQAQREEEREAREIRVTLSADHTSFMSPF